MTAPVLSPTACAMCSLPIDGPRRVYNYDALPVLYAHHEGGCIRALGMAVTQLQSLALADPAPTRKKVKR